MVENSKIEWTDHTFNPWIGCTKVSPGCANCYAETLNNRMKWAEWGKGGARHRTAPANWLEPLKWNRTAEREDRPQRVFCASLADWLDDEVPAEWLADLLALIYCTNHLIWLMLSKRPELLWERFFAAKRCNPIADKLITDWQQGNPPRNLWLGTSAEDQERWDDRVNELMRTPAAVHFVSAEPLLGEIDMNGHAPDWLIVGGESGPGARPMDPRWARSLLLQSNNYGTAFFFKQWGGVNKKKTGRLLDGQAWNETPKLEV